MACRRAFDVDLVACLLDRERPEWQDFRDHYPTCSECAAEVRTWTELHAELTPAHPVPARLLALEDRPATLPADERHAIHEHVQACTACRDELTTLRRTDIPALVRSGTAVVAPLSDAPAPVSHHRERRRGGRVLGRLRGLVLHPAFAYGVAIALLIPALAPYVSTQLQRVPAPVEFALRTAPPAASEERALAARETVDGQAFKRDGDAEATGAIRGVGRPAVTPPAVVASAPSVAATAPSAVASAARGVAAPPKETDAALADAAQPQAINPPAGSRETTLVGWNHLTVTPGSSHSVAVGTPGLILRFRAPAAVSTLRAELRIRDVTGRRELREQHPGPPARVTEMRVPGRWLVPGRYTVALHTGTDEAVATARLDVSHAPR